MRVTPACDTLNSVSICERPWVQTDPAVTYTGEKYVVVWSDAWFTGSHYWLASSCVDTAGNVLGTGVCVGAQSTCSELRPDIAFDGERCLVVWYNYNEPFGVYGRFLDQDGLPEDTVLTIAQTLASYNVDPKIVFAGDRYLVVWADKRDGYSDLDVIVRFVSTQGDLIGAPLVIATGASNQIQPAVAYDGDLLLITWCEDPIAIFGQHLHPDGTLLGSNFSISDDLSYYRVNPAVQSSTQNFLVIWSETRDGDSDIFGNIDVATPVGETNKPSALRRSATIFSGQFELPFEAGYRVYDISGREVTDLPVPRGIYFIEYSDRVIQKIVKVK